MVAIRSLTLFFAPSSILPSSIWNKSDCCWRRLPKKKIIVYNSSISRIPRLGQFNWTRPQAITDFIIQIIAAFAIVCNSISEAENGRFFPPQFIRISGQNWLEDDNRIHATVNGRCFFILNSSNYFISEVNVQHIGFFLLLRASSGISIMVFSIAR